MKKLAVTLSLLAVAAAAFAQGSVNMNNTTTTTFRTNSAGSSGTAGAAVSSAGGPFIYATLTAPSTVTSVDASLQALLSSPWSDTGLQGANSGLAGRENGVGTTVNNWAAGLTNSFIVVGWSSNEGASWSQLAARLVGAQLVGGVWSGGTLVNGGFVGATTVSFMQAGGVTSSGTIPTTTLFGAGPSAQGNPITSTTDLFVVAPEPTSFALVGLGAAAMMIFRRRKA